MNRKALMIAVLALIAVISVGSCSAGWFDFITGEPDLEGQEVNLAAAASLKNVFDDELIQARDLNERKAKMLSLSDVFVVLPGGYGTLDEFISIFTSLAFADNKTKQIILLNQNHLFDNTLEQIKVMIQERLMEQELMWRVKVASTPQECCNILDELNITQ